MIEIVLGLAAILLVFYFRQQQAKTVATEFFYALMIFFVIVILFATLVDYYNNYSAFNTQPSLTLLSVASSTPYLNNATLEEIVYGNSPGSLTFFMGNSIANLTAVTASHATYVGIGSFSYNETATLIVPPQWYWKAVYTGGNSIFYGEYT